NKNYSPELFHFSTHAYFLPQKKSKSNTDGIYTTYRRMGDFSLIQSGIVLSGANKNWSVTDSSYYDDGILTAFEISQLNLQKTKLVVLSACDTGVGEISNSEGVYGLRRAFKIAGVDKILMSLWSVADYQTMEFMNLFYENLCTKKLSPRLALCATQKTMRQKKYEPYYWAGFVLIE
ncbi:MAG: CHAT domain-containing protein, partial [Saprospiraceae bacterium]